jgi:hypothetical protein
MKILIDMNLSPDWVLVFAKYSIDSVHWSNVGDPTASTRTSLPETGFGAITFASYRNI